MGPYFQKIYLGPPFELFEASHLITLGLVFLLNVLLVLRRKHFSEETRKFLRKFLAFLLLAAQSAWIIWLICIGEATLESMLPLDICSFFILLSVAMLWLRSYRLYEFSVFMGTGGALAALITPAIGFYRFPHFLFIQTMLAHAVLLTAQVYMTAVEGFQPTWKSLGKTIVFVNLFMLGAALANIFLGSNFLFLAHKPEGITILSFLGPWPWYILWAEVLGFSLCALLVIPFQVRKHKK